MNRKDFNKPTQNTNKFKLEDIFLPENMTGTIEITDKDNQLIFNYELTNGYLQSVIVSSLLASPFNLTSGSGYILGYTP